MIYTLILWMKQPRPSCVAKLACYSYLSQTSLIILDVQHILIDLQTALNFHWVETERRWLRIAQFWLAKSFLMSKINSIYFKFLSKLQKPPFFKTILHLSLIRDKHASDAILQLFLIIGSLLWLTVDLAEIVCFSRKINFESLVTCSSKLSLYHSLR